VLWLYDSRARGEASATSDYDLAIAFTVYIDDLVERRLGSELLALSWTKALNLPLFTRIIITVVWLNNNELCQNGN